MKKYVLTIKDIIMVAALLGVTLLYSGQAISQVKIGGDPTTINPSAILELEATAPTFQGFLPPRLTEAEMRAIENPVAGLTVFCTTCTSPSLCNFDGTSWYNLTDGMTYSSGSSMIFSQLSTSVDNYNNANAGDWFQITKAEYDLLASNVTGALKSGYEVSTTNPEGGYYSSSTIHTTWSSTPNGSPLGNYLIAFAIHPTGSTGTGDVRLLTSDVQDSGFEPYGNRVTFTKGPALYYALKDPDQVIKGQFYAVSPGPDTTIGHYPNSPLGTFYWSFGEDRFESLGSSGPLNHPALEILSTSTKSW